MTNTNLPAGRELDERVCRLFEPAPPLPDNEGINHAEALETLRSPLRSPNGWWWLRAAYGYNPRWEPIAVSTDGNAMLRLIAAMRERGWRYSVGDEAVLEHDLHWARFSKSPRSYREEGLTASHAVALAALAALGGKDAE